MAYQLVYTSVRTGLVAGRSGFCTAARHREIRDSLVGRIEEFSNVYDRREQEGGAPAELPVIFSYRRLSLGSSEYHVLSRIKDAGSDYSGRVNHIAHSLVLEPGELQRVAATPAEVMIKMSSQGGWLDRWTEDHARFFEANETVDVAGMAPLLELPAKTWERSTGAAACAALPHAAAASSGCYIVYDPATGPEDVLRHIAESLLLKDPARKNPASLWETSFTTFLQASDQRIDFHWSACARNSAAHARARKGNRCIIELSKKLTPPEGFLAQVAADPQRLETRKAAAVADGGIAGESAVMSSGAPVPHLRPAARGEGGGTGRTEFDQEDFDRRMEAAVKRSSEKFGGGAKKAAVAVAAVLVLGGAAFFVAGLVGRRGAERVAAELDRLVTEKRWEEARGLASEVRGKEREREPLKRSLLVLAAAEELRDLVASVGANPFPDEQFADIASRRRSIWDDTELVSIKEEAREMIAQWSEVRTALSAGWDAVAEMRRAGVSPDQIKGAIEMLPPKPRDAAQAAMNRLMIVDRQVQQFQALKEDSKNLDAKLAKERADELGQPLLELLDEDLPVREKALIIEVRRQIARYDFEELEKEKMRLARELAAARLNAEAASEAPSGAPAWEEQQLASAGPALDLPPTYLAIRNGDEAYDLSGVKEIESLVNGVGVLQSFVRESKCLPVAEGAAEERADVIGSSILDNKKGRPLLFKVDGKGDRTVLSGEKDQVGEYSGSLVLQIFGGEEAGEDPRFQLFVHDLNTIPDLDHAVVTLKAADFMTRVVEGDRMAVAIKPERLEELASLRLPSAVEGAELLLRGEFKNGRMLDQIVPVPDAGLPFGDLEIDMAPLFDSTEYLATIEKRIKMFEEIGASKEKFMKDFNKLGGLEGLFEKTKKYAERDGKPAPESLSAEDLPTPFFRDFVKNLTETTVGPAFVQYVAYLVRFVDKSVETFDRKKTFSGTIEDSDETMLRRLSAPASTEDWGRAAFDDITEDWLAASEYAEHLNLGKESGSSEGVGVIKKELRENNTVHFFKNWQKIFTEEALEAAWPYLSWEGTDESLAEELDRAKKESASVESDKAVLEDLKNAPVAEVGRFSVYLKLGEAGMFRLINFEGEGKDE